MPTLSRPVPAAKPAPAWPALTACLENADGRARHRAICAWHARRSLSVLDQAIAEHPRFPVIEGGAS